ncbi:hypothetical protein ACFW9V_23445 [Streptomyces hygroscopicus]|uniref:hypothetical protein n=1 Tax=Streptomyces hygroscopicus TaxID=1912 RepID=UPI0036C27F6C
MVLSFSGLPFNGLPSKRLSFSGLPFNGLPSNRLPFNRLPSDELPSSLSSKGNSTSNRQVRGST